MKYRSEAADYYILDGDTPRPARLDEWAAWIVRNWERCIIGDVLVNHYRLRTKFHGHDSAVFLNRNITPRLWSTMLFGRDGDLILSEGNTTESHARAFHTRLYAALLKPDDA